MLGTQRPQRRTGNLYKEPAHRHLVEVEAAFVVQPELGDHHPIPLARVILPHAHVLLSPAEKRKTKDK